MYLNIEIGILDNILLNVKYIGWCLSFSEFKKMHGETLKFNKIILYDLYGCLRS